MLLMSCRDNPRRSQGNVRRFVHFVSSRFVSFHFMGFDLFCSFFCNCIFFSASDMLEHHLGMQVAPAGGFYTTSDQ